MCIPLNILPLNSKASRILRASELEMCTGFQNDSLFVYLTSILSGKIAASSGDASWVSSRLSRHRVFELRGRSDAIIVGGNTVRRDGIYLFRKPSILLG